MEIFFSIIASLVIVHFLYTLFSSPYKVGDLFYVQMSDRINFTQVYQIIAFENDEYTMKCISGKDTSGKDMVYVSKMKAHVILSLFLQGTCVEEAFKLWLVKH